MKEEMKNAVENALERLSSEQFTTLLISLDELEIWKEGLRYGIDGINDVRDRMNVIDHNFRKAEYEMYFNKLRELNFI